MSLRIVPEEFNTEWLQKIKAQVKGKGNPGTKKKIKYKNLICAFDIETTRIEEIEQSVMYVWQFQIGKEFTIIGRTWEQFTSLCERISSVMNGEYLCVFVHNLSYEFQFLRGIYPFEKEEVFSIKFRKVLKCTMFDCIEMRCSYMHSNMGLHEYTNKMGAEHRKKQVDEKTFYKKQRFSWTELNEEETEYITNDVLGLVEAISIEMEHDKDNLYTFPLTSTGYVRRDAKKAMREVSHTFVRNQLADYRIYQMCREAFRGGNTHANRYYAGFILHNVKSADRVSSYPDVLCNCEYPVSAFFHSGVVDFKELIHLINVRKKAVLMRVAISEVKLRDKYWGSPYLSRDKCRNIKGALFDNGRILEADYLETTMTDVDFKIFLSEYDFKDFVPFDVAHARYGKLPPSLINIIIKYFEGKTSLKNVEEAILEYMKSKNKINAIYGMMAQDPVKQTIDFVDNDFKEQEELPEKLLETYNKRAFLCYQWGVWTTAWSRYRLEEGIRLAGEGFVYADTDSVKYLDEIDWDSYNKERISDSKKTGAFAKDKKGNIHYMGVYESEGEYFEFSTLGAKKYVYRKTPESELKVTISGVVKKFGGQELEKAGGISAFKEDFIFYEAGGNEAIYNDNPEITEWSVDGHKIDITSNVVIKESTYTLGVTAEYKRLLEIAHEGIDI